MALSDKDISTIDKYLNQKMTEEEKSYFEKRTADDEFIQELRMKQNLATAMDSLGREKRKQILWEHEKKIITKPAPKSRKNWIIGMLVVILIIFTFIAIYINQTKSTHIIYADLYEPFPNVISPIQMGDENADYDVFQLYEIQEFDSVIENLGNKQVQTKEEQFYLALAYLHKQEWGMSKSILESLNLSEFRFEKATAWYLALSYLGNGQMDEAEVIMLSVAQDSENPFSGKAQQFLDNK